MYSQGVLKHFRQPKNFGKIPDADGIGKVGNIVCGDVMWLYIKLGKNKSGKDIIQNIKFETFGCVAAIATSNMIVNLAKGKSLDQALQINKDKIVKSLGGLPPIKLHCSVLAVDALSEAIYNYLVKNKQPISVDLKKRHLRIKKEMQIITEKYQDWINTEEATHNKS